jgi:hypothetical protein
MWRSGRMSKSQDALDSRHALSDVSLTELSGGAGSLLEAWPSVSPKSVIASATALHSLRPLRLRAEIPAICSRRPPRRACSAARQTQLQPSSQVSATASRLSGPADPERHQRPIAAGVSPQTRADLHHECSRRECSTKGSAPFSAWGGDYIRAAPAAKSAPRAPRSAADSSASAADARRSSMRHYVGRHAVGWSSSVALGDPRDAFKPEARSHSFKSLAPHLTRTDFQRRPSPVCSGHPHSACSKVSAAAE